MKLLSATGRKHGSLGPTEGGPVDVEGAVTDAGYLPARCAAASATYILETSVLPMNGIQVELPAGKASKADARGRAAPSSLVSSSAQRTDSRAGATAGGKKRGKASAGGRAGRDRRPSKRSLEDADDEEPTTPAESDADSKRDSSPAVRSPSPATILKNATQAEVHRRLLRATAADMDHPDWEHPAVRLANAKAKLAEASLQAAALGSSGHTSTHASASSSRKAGRKKAGRKKKKSTSATQSDDDSSPARAEEQVSLSDVLIACIEGGAAGGTGHAAAAARLYAALEKRRDQAAA